MPDEDKLSALFQLLKEMTVPPRKNASRLPMPLMRRIANGMMIALVAVTFLLVIAVASYRFHSPVPSHSAAVVTSFLAFVALLLAFFYPIIATIDMAWTTWRRRGEYFPLIFEALEKSLRTDARFLARLWEFDKPTLEYGLIQYRHHWGIPDRRIGSLVGEIRKIGLLPALVTIGLAAHTMIKADSHPYVWMLLATTGALYVLGFIAMNQHERTDQVIAVVEYAIRHADDPPVLACIEAVPTRPESDLATPSGAGSTLPA